MKKNATAWTKAGKGTIPHQLKRAMPCMSKSLFPYCFRIEVYARKFYQLSDIVDCPPPHDETKEGISRLVVSPYTTNFREA